MSNIRINRDLASSFSNKRGGSAQILRPEGLVVDSGWDILSPTLVGVLELKNPRNPDNAECWHIDIVGSVVIEAKDAIAFLYAPSVAQVLYGCGGTSTSFECDADLASFTIAAETCRVTVAYTQLTRIPATDPLITNINYPKLYRLNAQGKITTQAKAGSCKLTRTFMVVGSSSVNTVVEFAIPARATSWCFVPFQPVEAGDLPLNLVEALSTGDTIETVIPEVCASMARMHAFRKLPARATHLEISVAPNWSGQLIFGLEV